jgi:hypothetical protein
MVPIMLASAFINNTPIVALMIPILISWGRRWASSAVQTPSCTAAAGSTNSSKLSTPAAALCAGPAAVSVQSCRCCAEPATITLLVGQQTQARTPVPDWCVCMLAALCLLQVRHQPQEAAHTHVLRHTAGGHLHPHRHINQSGGVRPAGGQIWGKQPRVCLRLLFNHTLGHSLRCLG